MSIFSYVINHTLPVSAELALYASLAMIGGTAAYTVTLWVIG